MDEFLHPYGNLRDVLPVVTRSGVEGRYYAKPGEVVSANGASAAVVVYLPVSARPGAVVTVMLAAGPYPVSVETRGGETLVGDAAVSAVGASITAMSNGDGVWRVAGGHVPSALYARPTLVGSPASGVVTALKRDISVCMQLTGDSTGDGTGVSPGDVEWYYRLGDNLAARYPNFSLLRMQWNDTNSSYDPPTVIRTGPLGLRSMRFTGTGSGSAFMPTLTGVLTGDMRIEVKVSLDDWTPASSSDMVAQYTSSGNQCSWRFGILTTGKPYFWWSTDGTTTGVTKQTSTTPAYTDGSTRYLAVEHDVDNGAGGNDIRFYESPDGVTWTQIGSTVTTAGTTSHHASTGPYTIGSRDVTHGAPMVGNIGWVRICSGLGVNAYNTCPPLPDMWTNTTSVSDDYAYPTGSPTLLLINGSQGGQDIDYFDDATRRPKLFANQGQQLVFVSTSNNDDNLSGQDWVTAYSGMVGHIQGYIPGVPVACMTQEPTQSPPRGTSDVWVRKQRGVDLVTWAASQGGVYAVDTYPAFTNPATMINSDGVHPLTPGSIAWMEYVWDALGFGF